MSVTSESLEVRQPAVPGQLVRLGSREQLITDISQAVQPGVSPRALVLLALDGFREYHDRVGLLESRTLLAELAGRLEEAVASVGTCYRARDDEFAVLCDAQSTIEPLVDQAAATLREPGLRVSVGVFWGSVVLPDEASDPGGALRLADQRLAANRPMRRAGQPPIPVLDPGDPLVAIHGEIVEASAAALKMKQVDQLLDVATTLAQLAEAVRVDDHANGRLRGPREPARIPLLLKELALKLAALHAFGGPELDQAVQLAAEPNAPFSSMPPKVLAALDQIGLVLSGG